MFDFTFDEPTVEELGCFRKYKEAAEKITDLESEDYVRLVVGVKCLNKFIERQFNYTTLLDEFLFSSDELWAISTGKAEQIPLSKAILFINSCEKLSGLKKAS